MDVVWLGPHRFLEPLRPFGSWTSAGRWIRVFFSMDPNGERPGEARVAHESDERVVIALSAREPASLVKTLIAGYWRHYADVELREPIGDRVVIDASAGVARSSLAQLGLPTKAPPLLRVISVAGTPAPRRRRAQVCLGAMDEDAVYEAMLPIGDPPVEDGQRVLSPAVRRDVLEAIARDVAKGGHLGPRGPRLSWVDDALVAEDDDDGVQGLLPGPDGLYEVTRLGVFWPGQWLEVDPPLPDGPTDADTAVDLLSRMTYLYPTLWHLLRRLDLDVLHAVRAQVTDEPIRDNVDDEITRRTHGPAVEFFARSLRELERGTSENPHIDAHRLSELAEDRQAILAAVPDAGERVLALARAEREPDARGWLAAALGGLGHAPAIPHLTALLDDPHRHVRTLAAWALGALCAREAATALRRALATERRRPEPSTSDEEIPVPSGDEAEAEIRAALLAVTEDRYDPHGAYHPYPWVTSDD